MIEKIKKIFCRKNTVEAEKDVLTKIDEMFESLDSDVITLLIGEDFLEFKDLVIGTISEIREELKENTGFILPPVHIMDDEELQENEFVLQTHNKEVLRTFVIPNSSEIKKEIDYAIRYLFNNNIKDIFTSEITEKYINFVQRKQCWTVWNLTCTFSVAEIREVLINVLENKKTIRNISYIFEKFAEYALGDGYTQKPSVEKVSKKLNSVL